MPAIDDLEGLARAALRAARAASEVILGSHWSGTPETKGIGDYVTEVDRRAEDAIVSVLTRAEPGVPVVGEEGGGSRSGLCWVVDPLDGTTNFVHGFPVVGVSIALVDGDRPLIGVVEAPFLGQSFHGHRGGGAWLTERGGPRRRLQVSDRVPDRALIATGFPFRHREDIPRHAAAVQAAFDRFEDVRRAGAAALDLAWVAAGTFEGYFERWLSSWDVAAGALLVEEAGGIVTDWSGGTGYLAGDIVAASPAVHPLLLEVART